MLDGSMTTQRGVGHIPNLKRDVISSRILDTKCCSYRSRGGVFKASFIGELNKA